MNMKETTRFTNEIRINAPQEKVWAAVQDYSTGVRGAWNASENQNAVVATRPGDVNLFRSVPERIKKWKDGERSFLRFIDRKKIPPFESAEGRFALHTEGQETVVNLSMQYKLKFGILSSLLDRIMVRSQLRKAILETLAGLKRYAEVRTEGHAPVKPRPLLKSRDEISVQDYQRLQLVW